MRKSNKAHLIVISIIHWCTPLFFLFFMSAGRAQTNDQQELAAIIKEVSDFKPYDKEAFPLGKFTEDVVERNAKFAQAKLERLTQMSPSSFSETERISWELLQFSLQDQIDGYRYKMYLNPVQADQGFHLGLNYAIRPILNSADAENYLKKLSAIPQFTDDNILLIRKGLSQGYSQPKIIFKGYGQTYNDHIVADYRESPFYKPFLDLPNTMDSQTRDSILNAAKMVIEKEVIPAFARIKLFFEEEYMPNTRETISVYGMPNGVEFYQNRINYYTTTTTYTAADIHNIGLAEVARIKDEMFQIMGELGFEGDFKQFLDFLRKDPQFHPKTEKELLMIARDIAKRIDAELPKFFKTLPRRPYGVVKVPDAIAPKYTAGRYNGGGSDTEPGYYLVNTYKLDSRTLYTLPALTAHESVPGHHLQGSLNKELGDSIPKFRRNMYLSAFGEGWALYTEFLAKQMGIYGTPYEEFGRLTYEMWRACRLVVDTGIHAKGWTRQEVVDYMLANTALSEHEVNTETDRYIGWPGQAISYKIGELKIRELRAQAEFELGDEFNIRDFHEVILDQGTVTLPILERRIHQYIATLKR